MRDKVPCFTEDYVLPLSKVNAAERARVEAILEREKRDPLSYANSFGYEYASKAEEYSDARALMTDWLVAEKCPQNLQKLRSGAKTEFLERFSSFGATEAKLNQIITTGDMYTFFGYLVAAGPVFRVEWNRNNSFSARSVVFYQFAGRFFSSALTSRLTVLENYPTLKKAAQMHARSISRCDRDSQSRHASEAR